MRPILFFLACLPLPALSQHLIWQYDNTKTYTCIYGEIEALATGPTIYYCGCNWWPGAPAGGYCGIQDRGESRLVIFSIWDTTADGHPEVRNAESRAKFNRFGGEGTGAHTHLDYEWPLKKTFRFYVTKTQAAKDETLCAMYFYDEGKKVWVHEASIASPNEGKASVATFGGMLNSFLENWSGRERDTPKLALYRLWVGTSPKDLTFINKAVGDGKWGVLDDSFYLAEGDDAKLAALFAGRRRTGGGKEALTVAQRSVPSDIAKQLARLPMSPSVK